MYLLEKVVFYCIIIFVAYEIFLSRMIDMTCGERMHELSYTQLADRQTDRQAGNVEVIVLQYYNYA